MGTRLYGDLQVYEIRAWHEVQPGDVSRPFFDVSSAVGFLRRFMHDPFAMTALRELTASTFWAPSLSARSDQDIIHQLAAQLIAGRLCLVPLSRSETYLPAGGTSRSPVLDETEEAVEDESPVRPHQTQAHEPEPPVPSAQATTPWITFQVLDDDTGAPVAGVDLRLRLPDGTVRTYTTGGDGVITASDLPAGTCDLEQMLDEEAFEVVQFD